MLYENYPCTAVLSQYEYETLPLLVQFDMKYTGEKERRLKRVDWILDMQKHILRVGGQRLSDALEHSEVFNYIL